MIILMRVQNYIELYQGTLNSLKFEPQFGSDFLNHLNLSSEISRNVKMENSHINIHLSTKGITLSSKQTT